MTHANCKPEIPHAGLIRAVLDGKTVQYLDRRWVDLTPRGFFHHMAEPRPYAQYRIKPEPVVTWHEVFKDAHVGEGWADREEVVGSPLVEKVLRLELDPDTLDVISARTEAP